MCTGSHFHGSAGRGLQGYIRLGQQPGELLQALLNHVYMQVGGLRDMASVDGVGDDIPAGSDRT